MPPNVICFRHFAIFFFPLSSLFSPSLCFICSRHAAPPDRVEPKSLNGGVTTQARHKLVSMRRPTPEFVVAHEILFMNTGGFWWARWVTQFFLPKEPVSPESPLPTPKNQYRCLVRTTK